MERRRGPRRRGRALRRLQLRRSGPWIGLVGLVSCFFLYVVSGILAPLWAVFVLVAVWSVHFILALRWFSARPYVVLLLPIPAVVIWFAAMLAGGAWLGWSA